MTIHLEITGSPTLCVQPSKKLPTTVSARSRIVWLSKVDTDLKNTGGRILIVMLLMDGWLEEMLLAIRLSVTSEGCSVWLKGLAQLCAACRGGKSTKVQKIQQDYCQSSLSADIPKLETIKSLNLVTVESRILGPKKLRKVVLVDALKSIGDEGAPDFLSRSLAEATDSAVL